MESFRPLNEEEKIFVKNDGLSKEPTFTVQYGNSYRNIPSLWVDEETNQILEFNEEEALKYSLEYEKRNKLIPSSVFYDVGEAVKAAKKMSVEGGEGSGIPLYKKIEITPQIMALAEEQSKKEDEDRRLDQILSDYVKDSFRKAGYSEDLIYDLTKPEGGDVANPDEQLLLDYTNLREADFLTDTTPELIKGAATTPVFTKGFGAGFSASLPYTVGFGPVGATLASGLAGLVTGLGASVVAYSALDAAQDYVGLDTGEVIPSERGKKLGYEVAASALGGGLAGMVKSSFRNAAIAKGGADSLKDRLTPVAFEALSGPNTSKALLNNFTAKLSDPARVQAQKSLEKIANTKSTLKKMTDSLDEAARLQAQYKLPSLAIEGASAVGTGFAGKAAKENFPDNAYLQFGAELLGGMTSIPIAARLLPVGIDALKNADLKSGGRKIVEGAKEGVTDLIAENEQKAMTEFLKIFDTTDEDYMSTLTTIGRMYEDGTYQELIKDAFPGIKFNFENITPGQIASALKGTGVDDQGKPLSQATVSKVANLFTALEALEVSKATDDLALKNIRKKSSIDKAVNLTIEAISEAANKSKDKNLLEIASRLKVTAYDEKSRQMLQDKVNNFLKSKEKVLGEDYRLGLSEKELLEIDEKVVDIIKDHYKGIRKVHSKYYDDIRKEVGDIPLLQPKAPNRKKPNFIQALEDEDVISKRQEYEDEFYKALGPARGHLMDMQQRLGYKPVTPITPVKNAPKIKEQYENVLSDFQKVLAKRYRPEFRKSNLYKRVIELTDEAKDYLDINDSDKLSRFLAKQGRQFAIEAQSIEPENAAERLYKSDLNKVSTQFYNLQKKTNELSLKLDPNPQLSTDKSPVTYFELEELQRSLSDQINLAPAGSFTKKRLILLRNAVMKDIEENADAEDNTLIKDAMALVKSTYDLEGKHLIEPLMKGVLDSKYEPTKEAFIKTLYNRLIDPNKNVSTDAAAGIAIGNIQDLTEHYARNGTTEFLTKNVDSDLVQTTEGLMLATINSALSHSMKTDLNGVKVPDVNKFNEWVARNSEQLEKFPFLKKLVKEDLSDIQTALKTFESQKNSILLRERDLHLVRKLNNEKDPLSSLEKGIKVNPNELGDLFSLHKVGNLKDEGINPENVRSGLKDLIVRYAVDASLKREGDLNGDQFYRTLFDSLKGNSKSLMDRALDEGVFSPMEYKRVKVVAATAQNATLALEGGGNYARTIKDTVETGVGPMMKKFIAKITGSFTLGAGLDAAEKFTGRKFTTAGNSLIMHSGAAQAGEYFLNKAPALTKRQILRDILLDPKTFSKLIKKARNPEESKKIERNVIKHLMKKFNLDFIKSQGTRFGAEALRRTAPLASPKISDTLREEEPQPASQPPTPRRTSQVPQNTAPEPFLQGMIQQQGQRPQQMAQLTPEQKERGTQELADSMGIGKFFS